MTNDELSSNDRMLETFACAGFSIIGYSNLIRSRFNRECSSFVFDLTITPRRGGPGDAGRI
jgi:hypothetical protein